MRDEADVEFEPKDEDGSHECERFAVGALGSDVLHNGVDSEVDALCVEVVVGAKESF